MYKHKIETLTEQYQESEKVKKDAETKASKVTSHFRVLQNTVKCMGQKWGDEKEELVKSHKEMHATLIRELNAERQALDISWLFTISLHILHELVLPDLVAV
ncbi:hypothetical protein QE152_g33208 [Popillia japonica]|uniref:Uncharacterized protein n=1 Tax=Popillia japonica TaxID=7064 RepID=A0AAW1IXJ1_POPJA